MIIMKMMITCYCCCFCCYYYNNHHHYHHQQQQHCHRHDHKDDNGYCYRHRHHHRHHHPHHNVVKTVQVSSYLQQQKTLLRCEICLSMLLHHTCKTSRLPGTNVFRFTPSPFSLLSVTLLLLTETTAVVGAGRSLLNAAKDWGCSGDCCPSEVSSSHTLVVSSECCKRKINKRCGRRHFGMLYEKKKQLIDSLSFRNALRKIRH